MTDVDQFLPYVLPYAMGCSPSVAERVIVDAAIDFCKQSHAVQHTLDPMSAREGVMEYELYLPEQQELVQVNNVWFKGSLLQPVSTDEVRSAVAWRSSIPGVEAVLGDPRQFYAVGRNSIGIYPRPRTTESGTLTVRAATKPSRAATQLEDELYEEWAEAIAAGALQRLKATPGQPYTDVASAAAAGMQFQIAINKAKHQVQIGRVQGELSVRMRPFA